MPMDSLAEERQEVLGNQCPPGAQEGRELGYSAGACVGALCVPRDGDGDRKLLGQQHRAWSWG